MTPKRLFPARRPLGGYRLRQCTECSVRPALPGQSLCSRCAEREQREEGR